MSNFGDPAAGVVGSSSFLSEIPTTLHIYIPHDRDYAIILRQTEVVYDQLLAQRRAKLQQKYIERRQDYLDKFEELSKTDSVKVRSIIQLRKL